MTNLHDALCLDDFRGLAKRRLPRPLFGYISEGAEDNVSFRANRAAYRSVHLVPRVLAGVGQRSCKASLFGDQYDAPFGIAPMGLSALMACDGDVVLAHAAAGRVPMILSGSSLTRMEVFSPFGSSVWFQAYLSRRGAETSALLDRARKAGVETLVVTVDTAVAANRENNVRNGFSTPLKITPRLVWDVCTKPRWLFGVWVRTLLTHGMLYFENSYAHRGEPIMSKNVLRDFKGRGDLDWDDIKRIRSTWKGRLVLKGLLHWRDAERAAAYGVDGIIVSNHGGRQLDGAVAPLAVLPRIVDSIADKIPVMIDGGIRRGGDVLKALALGASFVFVGRPFLYAASVGGEDGVKRAIDLLIDEVSRDMGLLGINSIGEMTRDLAMNDLESNI